MNSFADVLVSMKVNAKRGATEFNAALESMEVKARSTGAQLRGAIGDTAADGLRGYASQVPVVGNALAGLSGPALAAAAAVGAVGLAFKTGIQELEDYNASIRGLQAVLRATGNSTGFTSEALVKFAEELEGSFAIAQEEIIGAEKVLSSFSGVSGRTFKEAITQAANLSAVYGGDLSSNSEKLGRVLQNLAEGSIDGLSKGFKFLTPATLDAIEALAKTGQTAKAQETLLQALEDRIGGTAGANAQGLTGAVFGLKDAWGDMLRQLASSTGAGDAAIGFIRGLTEEVEALGDPAKLGRIEKLFTLLAAGPVALAQAQVRARVAGDIDLQISLQEKNIRAAKEDLNAALDDLNNYAARAGAVPAAVAREGLAQINKDIAAYRKALADAVKSRDALVQKRNDKAAEPLADLFDQFTANGTAASGAASAAARAAAEKAAAAREEQAKAAARRAKQAADDAAREAQAQTERNRELAIAVGSAEAYNAAARQGADIAERSAAARGYELRLGRSLSEQERARLVTSTALSGEREGQVAVLEAELKVQRALTQTEKDSLYLAEQQKAAAKAEAAALDEKWAAARRAAEDQAALVQDQFRDLSDIWYDLFSGRVGSFWDQFKTDGLRALASVAAAFTLNPSGGLGGAVTAGLSSFLGQNSGSVVGQLLGGLFGQQPLSSGGFAGGSISIGRFSAGPSGLLSGFTGAASGGGSIFSAGENPFGRTPPIVADGPGTGGYGGNLPVGLGTGGLQPGFGAGSVGRAGVALVGTTIGQAVGGTAGAAISGASLGFSVGGPVGAVIGGAIGAISSLFGGDKTPRAGNSLQSDSSGRLAITNSFQKKGAQPTNSLADAAIDSVSRAAGLLGGSVAPNFYLGQIGTYGDRYVFQEEAKGTFGKTRSAQKFATAEEAIAASLASILRRGGITGVDEKYTAVLKNVDRTGSNVEELISLIERDRGLENSLLEITDPRAAALNALKKSFDDEVKLYEKYGLDKSNLTKLYLEQQKQIEKQYGQASARDFASIEQLIDQLTNGDLAGMTDRARFSTLQGDFSRLTGDATSKVDDVLRAAQDFAALNIDLNASTAERFRVQKEITEALSAFVANAKASDEKKASAPVVAELEQVTETLGTVGDTLTRQIGVSNDILERIRAGLAAQGTSLLPAGGGGSSFGLLDLNLR